ncbi:uncharacterized protein LOC128737176 [Sabethes cyaneus]|uniref:uncharacterized protein LOC128737176 n=1 Tax=Sabethes cyaneus TaxID=53552 RepID=UPI00237E8B92|nr:uncharacterized protein LOC128737176 [Sabethes cyaneus]XP_053687728.1 uncharacterized protein LOC128737176 [Sabethes cyaneus]XP_053687729.1 uncharacterized protein LOC128737176 [Sabethes cyaneus]XP_053687730.1 uncharacterized protein LOC128737176 [Sabethes cyaneus]XP_053687731.1 uncharacterized protein LOC128737176 [Sabethes cyaneus]XP_053687732.1 uncharacterized protein LOC128737176 [Sabethes cyaneus]XP_053687733.1 uncharacterized protein LOC128737176 [Sabethes cyaneus]XP_053687734.1 unc
MEKYVTVVSVDDQPASSSSPAVEKGESDHHQRQLPNVDIKEVSAGGVPTSAVDSQFVTVVSISHGAVGMEELEPEVVLVYRLPGERLGFGLKFQGGTKNNEKIQRLFIQSCAENSPASRVQASWGYLREGDEILEIDEVSVTRMTRIECVKCLKESNLAIKLLVRNGEGKVQNFYDENGDVPDRKSVPPPPPPVPPRKLNKRKSVDLAVSHDPPVKQLVEIVHPPDAEVYSNLFSDDISDLISESDDTASTISTVIDKYSICSSLSSEDYTISSNPSSLELAKALKPFTLLEKEFNLESKLENNLFTFQPASVNVVQLEVEAEPLSNDYENVSINKIEENKNYENIVVHASDHQPQNYENVTIQAVTEPQPYENVTITTSSSGTPEPAVYENVDLKSPPRPLPRQAAAAEQKKRAAPVANVVAPPRQKSPRMAPLPPIPPQLPHEFNTIQSWLQEATEVIHECALTANSAEAAKREKSPLRNAGSNENLPRLIDFHPKVSSPFKASPQPTIITIDNVQIENSEPTPEQTVSVKKCIKIIANDANAMSTNYIESSDDEEEEDEDENDEQEEEDEERIYEPAQMEEDRQLRCYAEIAGMGAFDSYSDEDGEKLGPPEIIDGGPSEAYFNYHWTTTLLPPIGEVEEEFSSLENQQSGPIVIIDTAEETLFNDSNNNQHREPKPKLNGHSSGETHQLGSENSVGKPVLALVPATKIEIFCSTPALQKPSSDPPARSSNRAFPGAGDGHSKQSDVIGAVDDTVEQETAGGDMRRKQSSSDTADKSQVQPNAVEVPTAATAIATSELNRTERDAEMRLDQLMNDLVDDNENSSTQSIVVTMEVDSTPEEVSVPQVEAKNESDRDVDQESNNTQEFCDEDMGLLVPVGDSVDSDFEELVKAQLDGDNSANSEQIQQIHERIIVGIERSSTSGDSGSEVEVESAVPKIDELRTGDCVNDDAKQTTPMDVPDCGLDRDAADADEQPTRNYQESGSSSPAALTPTAGVPTGSNSSSATTLDDEPTGSPTATIMDQMNNVVTTTTTATAIASTVYQQTTPVATSAGFLHKLAAAPPAFSRLPPDGHEFPPNFSEPSSNGSGVAATTMTVLNGNSAIPLGAKGDKHSSYDDIPDLPKSHPPAVPRKVFRQDLVLKQLDQNQPAEPQIFKKPPIFPSPVRSNSLVADSSPNGTGKVPTNGDETRRRSFDIHEINKPPSRVTLVGSNWRKDEKSERSVRDKIAMFSHGSGNGGGGAENEAPQSLRKFSKDFTKSSENLLGAGEGGYSRKSVDPIETYATLRKKAHSVENLDEVDSIPTGAEFKASESNGYKTKFSLETSKPVVLGKAYSVENLNPSNGIKSSGEESNKLESAGLFGSAKILSRTTSFSGYSNGNSLASISNTNNVEERRKSSITSLLEQRKKSMSKLRGLVIPEKVPETEVLQDSKIIGLPIIKSKDSEKIFSSNVLNKIPENSYGRKTATLPTPVKATGSIFNTMAAPKPPSEVGGTYKSIFRNLNGSSPKMEPKAEFDEQGLRRPLGLVPPAKPPRTSLTYPPTKGLDQRSQTTEDESDDSDSVLSSRVSTPPVSPVAPSPPEKYVLTRTLSSETNTSIASSNSTLTSSSGSQASCSSVGSTPAIDMSRRISKSSSSEMSMNRKNVLASAKSRSGRGDLKIEDATNGKAKRYEDGDSTDGYEEEERRKSKSKPRGSVGSVKSASNGFEEKEITHYKVVDAVDSIVDKVIKVASYVEVVSDVEENAGLETEVVIPMQKPVEPVREKNSFSKSNPVSTESGSANTMSDLAKWVRHEAAKTINSKESEAPARVDVKKFTRTISEQTTKISEELKPAVKRELRSSVDTKKLNLAEIRKSFEAKSNNSTVVPSPVRTAPKENHGPATGKTQPVTNNHDRFSSWDSLASSSSGVSSLQANSLLSNAVANCTGSSQTLQSTPSDYGSFSSLGSSHSLITPQDLQLIIEEADPPLATPEAFVIVLQRETPESSIGITLAGGSDYEAKEITIHKILNNSPAEKDGRLRRGDRILSINGLSMRGLTHRESLSVLKTPRPEVVMVITRSKSLIADNSLLAKIKRPSLGSLSSLAEKNEIPDYERKIKIQHKASRSLDLDLDIASNEAESVFDGTASEDGLLSADESKCSSITPASDEIVAPIIDGRLVEIIKDGAGLGFSIEGGFDSPAGNKPLLIKKIFMGGAAEKSGLLKAGEEIVAINDIVIERMTRIQVWNMMKKLPNGVVKITLK